MRRAWMLVLALGAGCRVTGEFHCDTSDQCRDNGTTGVCIVGSCAFGDADCTSGWRYSDSAEDSVAGVCLEGAAPADCGTWKPKHFTPCALPAPLGPLRLSGSGYIYDTDRGEFIGGTPVVHTSIVLPQPDGTSARIISVASFTLDPLVRLRVIGSLPLIIASWGTIQIQGRLDASSTAADLRGAGANFAGCMAAKPGAAGVATKGTGGGGGGGFAGAGGTGGTGDQDNDPGTVGGAGGAALAMPTAIVHGGCPGASGGPLGPGATAPATATSASAPGVGGGAVQLTARTSITVPVGGSVEANGGGGGAGLGNGEGGGGGGGSGGFVGLEAPAITVAGILAANGGGGGGGGSDTVAGGVGGDGRAAAGAAVGGGNAAQCSGTGATGSASTTLAGTSINPAQTAVSCGAGGGGGGAGAISIRATTFTMTGATFSPPVTLDP